MGDVHQPLPVLRIVAVFSRHPAAFAWARERAEAAWGPIACESEPYAFQETSYYDRTMGSGLTKAFWAFEPLVDPGELAAAKLATNAWEQEYASLGRHEEERPLNLDPGYLTAAKLVLASTKDHAHRIYLSGGIFAEVTLYYKNGGWRDRDWTFPDYRRADYQAFFDRCRAWLKQRSA